MKILKNVGVITLCMAICLSFESCSSSKNPNDSKKVKFKHFEVQYPKDWTRYGLYGYFYLRPKTYESGLVNVELNKISLINKVIATTSDKEYIDVVEKHAQQVTSLEKKRNFNIVKLSAESKFSYRIDYSITYNIFDGVFKRKEYFYETDNGLNYISIQFETELFDKYEKDINSIVNSFKIRDR